jgi:hypothetical protein
MLFNAIRKTFTFLSFLNRNDKKLLGRWGSVISKNKKNLYGYDCAKEFNDYVPKKYNITKY